MGNLPDLPSSKDEEFWLESQKTLNTARPIGLCKEHRFLGHADGTATCEQCPFGVLLGGKRVLDGKIIDLRDQARG